jgi:hypothetical protein
MRVHRDLASAQNAHFVGIYDENQEDMAGLKANSCENAFYAMSTPLMAKCGFGNRSMTLSVVASGFV